MLLMFLDVRLEVNCGIYVYKMNGSNFYGMADKCRMLCWQVFLYVDLK